MKPKKTNLERERKELCDCIVERAAEMMVTEVGAPIEMAVDRLLTYAAAQACTLDGSPRTAETFRRLADNIEAGCFHSVTGEDRPGAGKH